MQDIPVQVMLLPQARGRFLRKVHLLVIQALALLYQMQLLWKMVQFDLARVKAHPNTRVVSNPIRNRFWEEVYQYLQCRCLLISTFKNLYFFTNFCLPTLRLKKYSVLLKSIREPKKHTHNIQSKIHGLQFKKENKVNYLKHAELTGRDEIAWAILI